MCFYTNGKLLKGLLLKNCSTFYGNTNLQTIKHNSGKNNKIQMNNPLKDKTSFCLHIHLQSRDFPHSALNFL